ncbi:MAG: alpha/beta hydrolase [Myxococcota bacterium]
MLTEADATQLFRDPPLRHIDVGAGEVACRRVGQGPDVLFVHGWPVSGATFRTLLPHLAEHVTCHLVDLPGAGDSRFDADTPISVAQHIMSMRRVADALELEDFAVVGHDSGGMIARHAFAGDPRMRAMGLMNTEQPQGLTWRFRMFLMPSGLPGFGAMLGWALGQPWLRRHWLLLGESFADRSRLDGEFDELFLRPIHQDRRRRDAAVKFAQSFDERALVRPLAELHAKMDVPVQLVWGEHDPFLPLSWAEEMLDSFPDARLHVVRDASLFVHEERPEEVANALLPVLRTEARVAERA